MKKDRWRKVPTAFTEGKLERVGPGEYIHTDVDTAEVEWRHTPDFAVALTRLDDKYRLN